MWDIESKNLAIKNAYKYSSRRYQKNISILQGKTIESIQGMKSGSEVIYFFCTDGTAYMMYHEQDCYERVTLEDVCGNPKSLIDKPLIKAEDVSSDLEKVFPDGDTDWGHQTWTFYHFATVKGYVTLRWYGESNGYYSENVDFCEIVINNNSF